MEDDIMMISMAIMLYITSEQYTMMVIELFTNGGSFYKINLGKGG